MPSVLLGFTSGGLQLISGNPWSGYLKPTGFVRVGWDPNASGNLYVGLSGPMTANSGGYALSGGGMRDGVALGRGQVYDVPRSAFRSGSFNIFVNCDVASSGLHRVYYEVY